MAKYLAKIISSLVVGKTEHFVKDSTDFVKKIKDVEVPPGHKLISYDVSALFTSIPTTDAVRVIREYLEKDQTLGQRCPMSIEQLLSLLEFCLDTTYFVYNQNIYQQTHGAAMGSPVSPLIANVYMEDFEARALTSAPNPPSIWLRYVDDTFVKIREEDIEEFTNHINSIDDNIKFTSEREEDGKLAFLDVQIHVLEDGGLKTTVYRKATHTDQYLNGLSHHPLEHKRSVVRSLMNRADNIISTEEDTVQEKDHIRRVLEVNNFDQWMLTIPRRKPDLQNPTTNTTGGDKDQQRPVTIPYYRGLSEKLQRIFKTHGVPIYHLPWNTLRQSLVHPKDKVDKFQKCGTVYQIVCGSCDEQYIGESKRTLKQRFKEHTRLTPPLSAVGEHRVNTGHNIPPENLKVLDNEENWFRRRVKEAIHIKRHNPKLNRDKGMELSAIYDHVVSRERLPPSNVAQQRLHKP